MAVATPDPFVLQVTSVVDRLQERLARLIDTSCGADLSVTSISSCLGVHRKLAWQMSRVAYDQDPFTAARHIPSPKGMELFLSAARARGIDEGLISEVEEAAGRFEALVQEFAGDRASVDLMLSACSELEGADDSIRWRQQAFQGNSFLWGAQCRTLHSLMVQFPSAGRPGYFDMAQVRSIVGLRLNRPSTPWLIGQSVVVAGGVSDQRARRREALDPEGVESCGGAPVLRDHCKGELPRCVRRENASAGMIDDVLLPSGVGLRGERTIVTGEVIRELAPAHATDDDRVAHFGVGVRTPSQMLVQDLFVHRDLFRGVAREACVFSDLHAAVAFEETDRLRVPARLEALGNGLAQARSRDVPGYGALLRDVFSRLRLNSDEFALHRITLAYPPMPATVMFRHELPAVDGSNR